MLHDQYQATGNLEHRVQGDDIRAVEARLRLRLDTEALQEFQIAEQMRRQYLECHRAVEGGVVRLVHHTHAAFAKLADDQVAAEGAARLKRGVTIPTVVLLAGSLMTRVWLMSTAFSGFGASSVFSYIRRRSDTSWTPEKSVCPSCYATLS